MSPVDALWPISDLIKRRKPGIVGAPHSARRPTDSLLRVELPFGSDPVFRAAFVNFRGHLRFGKILEELDFFAGEGTAIGCWPLMHLTTTVSAFSLALGTIAYLHCSAGHGEPDAVLPTIVTASIDRVELLRFPLAADVNLVMSGMVTATGRSSMNVDVDFTTSPAAGPPETVLQASATFVARGASGSSTPVPPVVAVSDAEVALFERGRLAMEARRAERAHSLDREPPSGDELGMVHALFLQARSRGRRALL